MSAAMPAETKALALRRLIEAPEILVLPGAYDGFSARLVERTGYAAAFITGSGVSESRLGRPDVGLAARAEAVGTARDLAGCVEIPLLADADTGYGNAVNVFHTVREFERAGVAGVMIEDQTWPKRCGHLAGKEVISAAEMAGKVAAAAQARRDEDFVIMARTDVAASEGVEAAAERAALYAEAGADLLFADALLSAEDIRYFAENVPGPACVNMGFGIRRRSTTPLLSPRELEQLGVAVMIAPRMLTAAAARGMQRALEALSESIETGAVVDRGGLLFSFEEIHELMGMDEINELERRFLVQEQLALKYGETRTA
jgi:2-methylisocitrate lyase-like PEP mutase family enzyme